MAEHYWIFHHTEMCSRTLHILPHCKMKYARTGILTFFLILQFSTVIGFNLDSAQPIEFSQPRDSYFGYSVLQHENSNGKWVLVGAPRANSSHQPTLETPGAIYKCNVQRTISGNRCVQVLIDNTGNERSLPGTRPLFLDAKDDQWLGVSLTRQNIGRNGKVVTCAHRWANHYFRDLVKVILPNGACFTLNADLEFESINKSRPCLHEVQIKADNTGKGIAWHGWCQAGFSAKYAVDDTTLMLGAVGSLAWRGSVISVTDSSGTNVADVSPWYPAGDEDESYIGYSLTSGYFRSTSTVQGATGAPRAYERGQVYVYDLRNFALITEIAGLGMNTYFGASVLGYDINGDYLTDLLVGAPLYSTNQDEGIVYIYRNEGSAVFVRELELTGSNAPMARFGSVIESAGDINMDNYQDVVIGAPYEDDMIGAVYIYHGSPLGLKNKFAQRITPSSFSPGSRFKSFGHALSAGMDMDGNGYPDLVVGAYDNGHAALFLSRPVITMVPIMALSPEPIDIIQKDCTFQNKKVSCIRVSACFDYLGHGVPGIIAINLTIEADYFKVEQGFTPRVEFVNGDTKVGTVMNRILILKNINRKCIKYSAHIKKDVMDFLSPIPFKLSYALRTQRNTYSGSVTQCDDLCPIIDMYSPNNIVKMVSFIHNCGNDSKCETDLKLKASLSIDRNTPYLPHGVEEEFHILIEVHNVGEEAHQARVRLTLPQQVSFINVKSDPYQETMVICTPEEEQNSTTVKLVCDVDNPMPAFATSKFDVKLGVGRINPNIKFLTILVEASTSSIENNITKNDNSAEIRIPIKIEADITVKGVARPESVIYENKAKESTSAEDETEVSDTYEKGMDVELTNHSVIGVARQISLDSIGPPFKHIFDVRNLGPSTLPLLTTVNISFPWKTRDGDMITYIQSVQFSGSVSCDDEIIATKQSGLLDFEHWNSTRAKWENHPAAVGRKPLSTLNCDTVECLYLICTVSTLETGGGAAIEIQARIWEVNFRNLYENYLGYIDLISEARLSVINPYNRHIQPVGGRPDTDKVTTTFYSEAAVKPRSISKWLIALGIIFGLLGFVALVLFLAKMGFFKRTMKEEMERLIQEKDDLLENLNGEEQLLEDTDDDFAGNNGFFNDS